MFSIPKSIILLGAALLSLSLNQNNATAQSSSSVGKSQHRMPARPMRPRGNLAPSVSDTKNYFETLRKPVSIPELPDLGGAKFRFGLQRTQGRQTNIGLRYGTSSSPHQVIDFYKNSLTGWRFNSVTDSDLTATKGDRKVNVTIMPKGSTDVATDFMINYSYVSR